MIDTITQSLAIRSSRILLRLVIAPSLEPKGQLELLPSEEKKKPILSRTRRWVEEILDTPGLYSLFNLHLFYYVWHQQSKKLLPVSRCETRVPQATRVFLNSLAEINQKLRDMNKFIVKQCLVPSFPKFIQQNCTRSLKFLQVAVNGCSKDRRRWRRDHESSNTVAIISKTACIPY